MADQSEHAAGVATGVTSGPDERVPAWATILDAVCLASLLIALSVVVFGGFRLSLGDARISFRSAPRLLGWAMAAGLLRHVLVRRRPLHVRILAGVGALWRSEALRAVLPVFVVSRLAVLLVGYLAVGAVGYPLAGPKFRLWDNELWNLTARWDAGWFLNIARFGYDWGPNPRLHYNVAFFPAYPMLMRYGGALIGDRPMMAGLLVSLASFLTALVYLYRWGRDRMGHDVALASVALMATYPFAVFYSAVYSEALFLLASVAACCCLERGRPGRAGAWGLLAGLTRSSALFLSATLVVLALIPVAGRWLGAGRQAGRAAPVVGSNPAWPATAARLAAAVMPVVGILIYSVFVYSFTGHLFAWQQAHSAWGRTYESPVAFAVGSYRLFIEDGILKSAGAHPIDWLNAVAALFALGAVWPVTRRLGVAYGLLVVLSVLPPLLAGGYLSAGRLTAVLFPIFLWLAAVVPERYRAAWLIGFATVQGLVAVLFFTWRPLI
jgi:hypothetical protein